MNLAVAKWNELDSGAQNALLARNDLPASINVLRNRKVVKGENVPRQQPTRFQHFRDQSSLPVI